MQNFREYIESLKPYSGVLFFTTAKGSSYRFENGRTVRFKTPHQFHDTADVGLKTISDKTIFVHTELATEIGWWGAASGKKMFVLNGYDVLLISWNDKAQKWGKDRIHYNNTEYQLDPTTSLSPVELWQPSKEFSNAYMKTHPGSPITNITSNPIPPFTK